MFQTNGVFRHFFQSWADLVFSSHWKSKLIVHFFRFSGSKSGAYYLKTKEPKAALTYCHMEEISGCGGGGWTLVMKINGAKVEKAYKTVSKILRLSNLSAEDFIALIAKRHSLLIYYSSIQSKVFWWQTITSASQNKNSRYFWWLFTYRLVT